PSIRKLKASADGICEQSAAATMMPRMILMVIASRCDGSRSIPLIGSPENAQDGKQRVVWVWELSRGKNGNLCGLCGHLPANKRALAPLTINTQRQRRRRVRQAKRRRTMNPVRSGASARCLTHPTKNRLFFAEMTVNRA